jgi:hypothetical protein
MGAFTLVCVGSASAQQEKCSSIVLPNGTVLHCDVQNGQKVYVDDVGNVYNATSTGVGDFTVVNTGTLPCQATLDPVNISITSTDPVLGTITTTLDQTRRSTSSTIISNTPGIEFPATEKINFFAEATISSRPGKQYRSIQEVQLGSRNVNSFNPHRQERFSLIRKVDFEDVNNPGVAAFTLTSLSVTLDGTGGGGADGIR